MVAPFPFSAIVGQDEMKEALLLCAIEPSLGGVLVFGDRGTGKSTAIRGLAALLPEIEVREDCPYNSARTEPDPTARKPKPQFTKVRMPVVDLPLSATEDRVCGALDLERALVSGEKAFQPGLIAKAHRGFLYIDEVNLLEDHLVDLLLDVAASGENIVEREGLSVRHPAKFVLVGSGNPEEGELRPQLLDRFGLSVDVRSPDHVDDRVAVIRRREAYERNPDEFVADYQDADEAICNSIIAARKRVKRAKISDHVLKFCATLCMRLGVDGLRGELTLVRAATAHAALHGRASVKKDDVMAIAAQALRHRLRRDPLDDAGSSVRVERALSDVTGQQVGHA
ncbi:MAG: magnesium chelatase ATPase subunit I [Pseudomonadota bacterium]